MSSPSLNPYAACVLDSSSHCICDLTWVSTGSASTCWYYHLAGAGLYIFIGIVVIRYLIDIRRAYPNLYFKENVPLQVGLIVCITTVLRLFREISLSISPAPFGGGSVVRAVFSVLYIVPVGLLTAGVALQSRVYTELVSFSFWSPATHVAVVRAVVAVYTVLIVTVEIVLYVGAVVWDMPVLDTIISPMITGLVAIFWGSFALISGIRIRKQLGAFASLSVGSSAAMQAFGINTIATGCMMIITVSAIIVFTIFSAKNDTGSFLAIRQSVYKVLEVVNILILLLSMVLPRFMKEKMIRQASTSSGDEGDTTGENFFKLSTKVMKSIRTTAGMMTRAWSAGKFPRPAGDTEIPLQESPSPSPSPSPVPHSRAADSSLPAPLSNPDSGDTSITV